MKILVLNCGSSSVKLQLIETGAADRWLARALADRIGMPEGTFRFESAAGRMLERREEIPGHTEAIGRAISVMLEAESGVLRSAEEIDGVGHRIVHGGDHLVEPVRLDDSVARLVEEAAGLAPLHNPHNLKGYHAVLALFPWLPQVAVFDTAFHHTIPEHAYTYGLPHETARRHQVRRYGFHGTSHHYVASRFAELHGEPYEKLRLITCHLGNGCSICAVSGGRSVDTSMGFTPLEGLLMGTRSGDVDVGAVLHIMDRDQLTPEQMLAMLNGSGGMLGISGVSNDVRELLEHSREGHARARLALDVFCYRVKKYVGAYLAVLNGADAVIFTGGIGENAPWIRARVLESMEALGVAVDPARNEAAVGREADISAATARTKTWVIPTNEELLIARETARCLRAG